MSTSELLSLFGSPGRHLQKICGLGPQNNRQLADDLQANVTATLFQFTHIRAVYARFIGQILLGQALGVSQAPQIGCKDLAEIHAPANPDVVY
jgi:hypothetical protein